MSQNMNVFHADNWRVMFSDIPTCPPAEMYLYDNFIKSVNFPEYGLNVFNTEFLGYRDNQPIAGDKNRDLTLLQIEIKLSENLKNYVYLFQMINNLRYGKNIIGNARDYTIKTISVTFLDNMKRSIGRFDFTGCIPINVTAVPLTYGTSEEVTFQCNLNYNQIIWVPENISECES